MRSKRRGWKGGRNGTEERELCQIVEALSVVVWVSRVLAASIYIRSTLTTESE